MLAHNCIYLIAFPHFATIDAMVSPGAMALAATTSESLAERVSNATAQKMRVAGINWVYSPVADVNSDARNPVIGMANVHIAAYHTYALD